VQAGPAFVVQQAASFLPDSRKTAEARVLYARQIYFSLSNENKSGIIYFGSSDVQILNSVTIG